MKGKGEGKDGRKRQIMEEKMESKRRMDYSHISVYSLNLN